MFDEVTERRGWDPHWMIINAKSLQKIGYQLASDQELPSEPDIDLFRGKILASAILLPLATEIALKAWQCRERKGAPDRSHDLLKLFEGLSEDAQAQLEEGLPVWLDPLSIHELCPVGAGMRKVLEYHRQSFEHWRYLYESSIGSFYAPALNEALTVIIETYDRNHAGSA